MLETVYKVVNTYNNKFYSIAACDNEVEYEIGEWTTAPIGKLFCFRMLDDAIKVYRGHTILECEAYEVEPILHCSKNPSRDREFWNTWFNRGYFDSAMKLDDNNYCATCIRPIRIAQSQLI